jgi:pimeloyl-ACP methyl ester carboxylesterase
VDPVPPPPDPWLETHVRHHVVDAGGVELHVAEAGAGRPMLFLHGFPDFWFAWRHQCKALAPAGFRVLAPDMRGFNLSGKPVRVAEHRLPILAGDVEAIVRHFALEDVTLVAHDWGAVVGWHVAMCQPVWLRRLAILNTPHPVTYLRGLRRLDQVRRSWYILYFQLPWLPEWQLRLGGGSTLRNILRSDPERPGAFTDDEIAYYVRAHLHPGALTGALNCYRAAFRAGRREFAGPKSRIDVPTLVLWGDADRYLRSELAEPPADLVPNAVIRHFPGASHWLMVDRADDVTRALMEHAR